MAADVGGLSLLRAQMNELPRSRPRDRLTASGDYANAAKAEMLVGVPALERRPTAQAVAAYAKLAAT